LKHLFPLVFISIVFIYFQANGQTALEFNGVESYVQTTYPGISGDSARTVMAWIKTTANCSPVNGGFQRVITDWGAVATGNRFTFCLLWYNAIRIEILGSGISGTIPVNDGIWHHVAVTYDPSNANNFALYVDGRLDVSENIEVPVNTIPDVDLTIGMRIDNNKHFDGEIDEVSIWNKALTQEEINDYSCISGDPGQIDNLVAYYDFNDGQGTILTDQASGGYDGTLVNMGEEDWVFSEVCEPDFYTITITVTDEKSEAPLDSVKLTLDGIFQLTDEYGASTFTGYSQGTYSYNVVKEGYYMASGNVEIIDSDVTIEIVLLSPSPIALEFDGVDDYVQTNYSGLLGTTPRTFAAWIYLPAAPSSTICIMDYGVEALGSRNTFLVNNNGFLEYISGGTNGNIYARVAPVPIGSWTHVAFVYDGTKGFLFQNGETVGQGSLTAVNTPIGGEELMIGERVAGGSIPFKGKIDEVSVWDVALTQQELIENSRIYSDPILINNLVSYYDFNDRTGNVLIDLAGNYNGTLMNQDKEKWDQVLQTILFICLIIGTLLSIFLFTAKINRLSNRLLGLLTLFWGIILGYYALQFEGSQFHYPHLLKISDVFLLSIFPLFFLQVKYLLSKHLQFNLKDFIHFLPLLLIVLMNLGFYIKSGEEKLTVLSSGSAYYFTLSAIQYYIVVVQGIVYSILALRLLSGYQHKIMDFRSNIEKKIIRVQRTGILIGLIVWIIGIIGYHSEFLLTDIGFDPDVYIYILLVLIVFIISYSAIKSPEIFILDKELVPFEYRSGIHKPTKTDETYSSTVIEQESGKDEQVDSTNDKLIDFIEKEKPYLNPELSLQELSDLIGEKKYFLSMVINQKYNKNFFEFINEYRINEVKERMKDPKYKNLKIISLAYDSGFNSKTSFNRVFKQVNNMTPSQYMKSLDSDF